MTNLRIIKWMLMASFICSPFLAHAQLLKGKVVGFNPKSVTIVYSPNGDIMENQYLERPVKDGAFEFDANMPAESTDVEVEVGNQVFGAHLVKGKTLEMVIERKDNKFAATYPNDKSGISPVVNRMANAYNIMHYFSMDGNDKRTYDDYRTLLDNEYASVKPLLKKIKDKKERKYYTLLNDKKFKDQAIRLLSEKAYNEKKKVSDYSEFNELTKDEDINDDICVASGLSLTKLIHMVTAEQAFKGDMGPFCENLMDLANKYVTNKKLHRSIVNTVGYHYFTFGDNSGDYRKFYDKFVTFAGNENVDIPKKYEQVIASWDKTKSGIPAPDITLTDRDDKQIQLSSLKGKFTYIDVWATWCGPCKKEIPFMEKMVEHFKGNDKVQFISISVDENVKAWKDMINKDNPQWAQYNVNKETAKQFMGDWGISGIPRFIMIDKNGNIFSADASRPSEEKTTQTIEEQIR